MSFSIFAKILTDSRRQFWWCSLYLSRFRRYSLAAVTSHPPTEELAAVWDFLSPGERVILQQFRRQAHRMEQLMSDLIAQLDTALATLSADSAGYEAVIQANQSTIAALQSALDASRAGEAADQAELQKALDTVTAVNEKLASLGGSTPPPSGGDSPDPAPSDPAPSDPGAPGQVGSPSDPVTVVEDPTPASGDPAPVGAEGAPAPAEAGADSNWSDAPPTQ